MFFNIVLSFFLLVQITGLMGCDSSTTGHGPEIFNIVNLQTTLTAGGCLLLQTGLALRSCSMTT